MNDNILNLYLQGISNEIDRLKSLGCSDSYILKKIQDQFKLKLGKLNTSNCNKVLEFVLYKKELRLNDKTLIFSKKD